MFIQSSIFFFYYLFIYIYKKKECRIKQKKRKNSPGVRRRENPTQKNKKAFSFIHNCGKIVVTKEFPEYYLVISMNLLILPTYVVLNSTSIKKIPQMNYQLKQGGNDEHELNPVLRTHNKLTVLLKSSYIVVVLSSMHAEVIVLIFLFDLDY